MAGSARSHEILSEIERALDASIAKCKEMPGNTKLNSDQMQQNRPLLRARMFDQMLSTLRKDSFLPHLLEVFKNSLSVELLNRKLEAIIAELKLDLPLFERYASNY